MRGSGGTDVARALLGPEDDAPTLDAPDAWGVFAVSSVSRTGLPALLEGLWLKLREVKEEEDAEAGDEDWGDLGA